MPVLKAKQLDSTWVVVGGVAGGPTTVPVSITEGGTAGTTAPLARTNLDVFSKGEIQGGANLSPGPILANDARLQGRETGGTARSLIWVSAANNIGIGDAAMTSEIRLQRPAVIGGYLKVETGDITIDNNRGIVGKTVGGVVRNLIHRNTGDTVVVGDGTSQISLWSPTAGVSVDGPLASRHVARAYTVVHFSTGAVSGGIGFTSGTRTGTGVYRLTLAQAWGGMIGVVTALNTVGFVAFNGVSSTQCDVLTYNAAGAPADMYTYVVVFSAT